MQRKKKALDPMAIVLILTIVFLPPLAPIALIIFLIHKRSKQEATIEDKTVENFGEKYIRRMKEDEVKAPIRKPHSHTPVSYSYDACAKEKRLEQLRVLKSAGLLDEVEYQQRRQAILK